MSDLQLRLFSHLVRRGYHAAASYRPSNATIQKLQHDAALYEQSGPDMEINPAELWPVWITVAIFFFLLLTIHYTVGEVIASLTMIESRTATAVVEDRPPAYADEPDAPLEKKESLMPAEAQADVGVEVILLPNKPVTATVTSAWKHLRRLGGLSQALYRGLGPLSFYCLMHNSFVNTLGRFLGSGILGQALHALLYVLVSVAFARLHMWWTHEMIASPSPKRLVDRPASNPPYHALCLPSAAVAIAQQATLYLPALVTIALGLTDSDTKHVGGMVETRGSYAFGSFAIKLLAVLATMFVVFYTLLIPATITLKRIEAVLLESGKQPLVPFDHLALTNGIDLSARGSSRELFVRAWRSCDRASRWSLLVLYTKMAGLQSLVILAGLHLIVAEIFLIGGPRLGIFLKSAAAQLQLDAMHIPEN